jgi:hypothetical protein
MVTIILLDTPNTANPVAESRFAMRKPAKDIATPSAQETPTRPIAVRSHSALAATLCSPLTYAMMDIGKMLRALVYNVGPHMEDHFREGPTMCLAYVISIEMMPR